MYILRCVGSKFCLKFQRFTLKFHLESLNPYTAQYAFHRLFLCVIYDIFELWRHKPQWDERRNAFAVMLFMFLIHGIVECWQIVVSNRVWNGIF